MSAPRLRLAPDTYAAPTGDGVHVLTHRGTTALTGPSVHRWLEQLAPHLDGRFTLPQLVATLDAPRRAVVERLVATLVDRGVLLEVGGHGAPTDPAERGDPEDADARLVGAFRRDAAAGVAAFRTRPVTVVGSGPVAAALLRAARIAGAPAVPAATTDLPSAAGLVLRVVDVADDPGPPRGPAELPVTTVAVGDGELWWTTAGSAPGWSGVRRRLRGLAPVTTATVTGPPDELAVTVAAAQVVRDAFRRRTGIPTEAAHATVLRCDTLAMRRHTVLAHPYDRPVRRPGPGPDGRLTDEEFSRRCVRLVDPRTGVLGELDEDGLDQLAVPRSRVRVADAVGLLGGPRTLVGAGPDFAAARYEAALRGLALYASATPDPRRTVDRDGTPLFADTDPWVALQWLRAGDGSARGGTFVPGVALPSGRPVPVPVAHAFPLLHPAATGCGVAAAGRSRTEALVRALLVHCRRRTPAGGAGRPLDPRTLPLDAAARTWFGLAAACGSVTVADLTGPLGVPAVRVALVGGPTAVGCGATLAHAVRAGLRDLLLAVRPDPDAADRPDGGPVDAGPEDPGLPGVLVDRLTAAGHRVAAVPLDHDPEVHAVIPHIISVVVTP